MHPHLDFHAAELRGQGYTIIRNVVARSLAEALSADLDARFAQTPFCDGDFYGRRTKRFGSLLTRSAHAAAFVQHPLALGLAEAMLGPYCDRIALNLTQAVEIHGDALAQYPHRDEDMWQGPKGEVEYLINIIWPLTPFTADNGTTRLWPGSNHHTGTSVREEEAIVADMAPGDMLVFLGSTLHGGGENRTPLPRRGLIVSYCLGWLKPFENQWLVYPPEIARAFSPELAALIGYAQHRPNLGNVEGQCPSTLLWGDAAEYRAATDALRADQAEALRHHVAEQEAAKAGLLGG
ncbi:phytanoyl-CoA dioxygenase family protein [Sphingomonas sp.]|uniref:phytanoyl-CoA dioxygenase family protein n=1 Tax=Sphingomonas sp. TaxID=28214 RepID=UPI000DB13D13|nr:phytanoyl-CoA dioxygenase family protein [Sphingomonas sp.]PZU06715.1 MAG: phytanoyl-CoA dioxygenase [Sphingomonas sp.]